MASKPGDLRTASTVPWPKGSKKTFMQPCGLRDLARPRGRRSFGPKTGQVADCIRGTLGPKGAKKHSCNPVGCGIWRTLGGDGRSAPRLGKLRTVSAAPLAERGLKNIHATLRAAGFGAPSGATVVWPQGRASCGLRPRHLGPKGSKKHSCNPVGCGIWRALGGDGRLASKPSQLGAEPATAKPKEARSEADR